MGIQSLRAMRPLVLALDRFLRWRLGTKPLCDDPRFLFRFRIIEARRPLPVTGGVVPAGTKALELHIWNEHLPPLPAHGPDLAWGVKLQRLAARSFRVLASRLKTDPQLHGVRAIGGVSVLFGSADGPKQSLFHRLGFKMSDLEHPFGRLGAFCQNVHSWMIMWAFNAVTLRHRRLFRLRRTEFWTTPEELTRRFAPRPDRGRRGRRQTSV